VSPGDQARVSIGSMGMWWGDLMTSLREHAGG
jgi:hypothetical protein